MKYDYPNFDNIINELMTEYRRNAKERLRDFKGNSWRNMKLGDLMIKLQEEQDEVQECINNGLTDQIRLELIDSILVSIMLFERLSQE